MKDLLDIIRARKSIRSFDARPVPRALVLEVIRAATYAPTNCNQQLWNFVVVTDAAIKERLVRDAAGNTMLRRAPAVIFVTYDNWDYKEAIQGASLAVGHLLLAAAYHGLAASPLNSYGADARIKRMLGIPAREAICCAVTLGYPDAAAAAEPSVPRRAVEEVVHFERFTPRARPPFTYAPDDWTLEDLRSHQRYYCRKTTLGKEMDIMSPHERALVRRALAGAEGPVADLLSYDGAYLAEFPDMPLTAIDLTEETAAYTKAAAARSLPGRRAPLSQALYDEHAPRLSAPARTVTLIYKLERLPAGAAARMLAQAHATLPPGGTLIVVSRKQHLLLWLFLAAIRLLFGPDIRRTGIYNFFGPYRPLALSRAIPQLRAAGFHDIRWRGYFLLPPFYEQAYQMFRQYLKSDGSSYLSRTPFVDPVSRALGALMRLQGFRRVGRLGSAVVITCRA